MSSTAALSSFILASFLASIDFKKSASVGIAWLRTVKLARLLPVPNEGPYVLCEWSECLVLEYGIVPDGVRRELLGKGSDVLQDDFP
jgi:hypothetical protein